MNVRNITPILNVSDMEESFAWFMKLGWTKNWVWGEPVDFGCVGSGEREIFLSLNGQGGRGRGTNTSTFKTKGDDCLDQGVWLSVWVEDVDAVHQLAIEQGIDVTCEPENMPWGVRECHLRHPDGHVLRVSKATR